MNRPRHGQRSLLILSRALEPMKLRLQPCEASPPHPGGMKAISRGSSESASENPRITTTNGRTPAGVQEA
jgi:hypothetical protein